jgi:hypothetical protein
MSSNSGNRTTLCRIPVPLWTPLFAQALCIYVCVCYAPMLIYGSNIPSKYLSLQTKVQDMSYEMTGWTEKVRFLSKSARHCVFKNTRETVPLTRIPISNGAQQSLAHHSFIFYPVLPTTVWFNLPSIFNLCTCEKTALSAPRDPNLTKKFVNSRWNESTSSHLIYI